mmetsp:Transcript_47355/g.74014  ORF Transcript_47355/g.74014 Transcript_47355/m.74014 type:complete len:90 (-) Transcript_47355:22-291(-)
MVPPTCMVPPIATGAGLPEATTTGTTTGYHTTMYPQDRTQLAAEHQAIDSQSCFLLHTMACNPCNADASNSRTLWPSSQQPQAPILAES